MVSAQAIDTLEKGALVCNKCDVYPKSVRDGRVAHAGSVEMFRLRAPETGLYSPKGQGRFSAVVRQPRS